MITKSDLEAVHEEMMAEERRRLGAPPSVDDMLAYSRGELSPADEERVRALLVCYPELARALATPFPTDDAKPDDPDYVSDEEVSKQWEALQDRLQKGGDGPQVIRFWRRTALALAASLVLAFGGLLWQARRNERVMRAFDTPQIVAHEAYLRPDGRRGPGNEPNTVAMGRESVLLAVPVTNDATFESFRLEIVNTATKASLWKSEPMQRGDRDYFPLLVPPSFLAPGEYEVVLYGVGGGRERRLATHTLRVPAP